jgi:hypothetical protein
LNQQLAKYYYQYALQYGVNPLLLMEQGADESGFNPQATSGAGAMGIAQFMLKTIQNLLATPGNPFPGYTFVLTDPSNTAPGAPPRKGPQGQILPGSFNPYNPQQAIELEAFYMQQLLRAHRGDTTAALSDYYGSAGPMYAGGPTYAQAVEGEGPVQVLLDVRGKVKLLNDVTNQMIGIGTITPQKSTIDLHKKKTGPPSPIKHPPKKRM